MAGLRNTSHTMTTDPPASQSNTGRPRSVAHEEAAALLAVHGLVEPELADAVDLDRGQGQVAPLARRADQPGDRDPAELGPQGVVLAPQVVRDLRGRRLALGT